MKSTSVSRQISRRPQAFTLVELLTVIAIVAILSALTLPAYQSISRSLQLTNTASQMVGCLDVARQTALARKQPTTVCFYSYSVPGEGKEYRSAQTFVWDQDKVTPGNPAPNAGWVPLSKMWRFSPVVVLDTSHSTLVTNSQPSNANAPVLPATLQSQYPDITMQWFMFMPDGSAMLNTESSWYTTFYNRSASTSGGQIAGLPANFITIQLDPLSGRTTTLRP